MFGYWGEVKRIEKETTTIQFLHVYLFQSAQEIKAIHYVYEKNYCQVGQTVQVNTSAIDLELGTGGFGFVMALMVVNQDQVQAQALQPERYYYPGHIMKLRYTPHQTPVLAVESPESEYHSLFQSHFSLNGKKVLLSELHSTLPIMASLIHGWNPERKIAYIMDDQAALHIAFSDHVRYLKKKLNLVTITYGQALGGDIETVNLYTALEAAVKVVEADDIIISQGPGVAGTGTQRGFSGMQIVNWVHAIHTCGGESIVIPRIQFGDRRPRHRGLSHHTLEPLRNHTLVSAHLPFPVLRNHAEELSGEALDAEILDSTLQQQFSLLAEKHWVSPVSVQQFHQELEDAFQWYGRPIRTMGRSYVEERCFFYAVGAAYHLYKSII
jgi:hypothetical protein